MIASCPVRTLGEVLFGERPILSCVPAPCREETHERMLNLGTQNEIGKYRIEYKPRARVHNQSLHVMATI